MKTWVNIQVKTDRSSHISSYPLLLWRRGGGLGRIQNEDSEDTRANAISAFTGCLTLSKFPDLLECHLHLAPGPGS